MIVCPICRTAPDRPDQCGCGRFHLRTGIWKLTVKPGDTFAGPGISVFWSALVLTGPNGGKRMILEGEREAVVDEFIQLAMADYVLES